MRGMDFDRIASSAPLDKTAATVTGAGEAFVPRVALTDYFHDMPETKPILPEHRQSRCFVDFTGVVVGRLTVIAMAKKEGKASKASWVCRCKCGGFCRRTARAIKDGLDGDPNFVGMCGLCSYNKSLASGWSPNLRNATPKLKAFGWKSKARAAE